MASLLTAFDVYRHLRRSGIRTTVELRKVAAAWRAKHVAAGDLEYAGPLSPSSNPIAARVDHGRWLVDCPCGNGAPVTPWQEAAPEAVCLSCGTVFVMVIFPANVDAIEQTLVQRRFRTNQNWRPSETLAQLLSENAANPLRVR